MEIEKIFIEGESKEVELEYEGVEIKLKVKPITWSKRNQILSRCFTYNNDGTVQFNFDRYLKEMLSEMIVEAPWGETNNIFLSRIKPEFGAKLEKLVPRAFEEGKNLDFFVKE